MDLTCNADGITHSGHPSNQGNTLLFVDLPASEYILTLREPVQQVSLLGCVDFTFEIEMQSSTNYAIPPIRDSGM